MNGSGWRRFTPSEAGIAVVSAVLVGVVAAVGVAAFRALIHLVETLPGSVVARLDGLAGLGNGVAAPVVTVATPVVGGLLVGWVMLRVVGPERHPGVAGIIESVALAGARLRWRRMPAKVGAAAVSIGAGAPVGPEDPSVQLGANLGSALGQLLRLSDDRMRTLVAAGAASGVAAAFNAPFAGVFFALEVILGEISGAAVGPVVLAAVSAAATTQAVLSPDPAFAVPPYVFRGAVDLPLYLLLGLAAGGLAAVYVRAVDRSHVRFEGLRLPLPARTALVGLLVGIVALWLPAVRGVGYATIEEALHGTLGSAWVLLAILVARLVLTPLAIGAGFPGGVFAPALVLGAMLGGTWAGLVEWTAPGLPPAGPAFATVGMAAVLAGAVHAPLTAVLLLFERTNDYRIILPLLLAVTAAMAISRRLARESVYSAALVRRGIRIERGRDVDVLERMRVEEVMLTPAPAVCEDDTVAEVVGRLESLRYHGLPVVDAAGGLVGVVTVQDLDKAAGGADAQGWRELVVGSICARELLVAYPDESVAAALRRMGARDIGRLPVVARDDPRRMLGLLRRADLMRAYETALTRRAALRHQAQQLRLGAVSEASVRELVVATGSPAAGRLLREVPWPTGCLVASVRRGGRLLVPDGATRLLPGDELAVVAETEAWNGVEALVGAAEPSLAPR